MADERVETEDERPATNGHGGGYRVDAVFVAAPALVDSGLKHTMGDIDGAIGPAGARLSLFGTPTAIVAGLLLRLFA